MDSRDRLPLIHEQPSSQKQSHQEREKNQQNQTKKDFESTEPTFRIENREKKSREIDRRSSCTSECLSSLVSSTRKSRAGVDVPGTLFSLELEIILEDPRPWHLRAPKHPVESTCPPSTTSSSSRVCAHEQRHKT